jgi:hypothetical protein
MNNFDPLVLAGIGTAPVIEQIIEYMKGEWGIPSKFAPIIAIVLAIGINGIIGVLLGWEPRSVVAIGLLTGFTANAWHSTVMKPNNT